MGTPGQTVYLGVDTDFDISWIMSANCSPAEKHKIKNTFDSSKSSTFRTNKKRLSVKYNTRPYGVVRGIMSVDTLVLAGFTAEQQFFILADVTGGFANLEMDGMLSLGYNSKRPKTFVQNLKEQGQIESSVFSLYLKKEPETLVLGDYDVKKYAKEGADIIWALSQGWQWVFSI